MKLYLEFDKLVRQLTAARVRFAVAGGLAVGLHGFVRATKDIDLLVMPERLEKIRKVLAAAGYTENPQGFSFRNSGLGLRRFYRRPPNAEELFVVDVLLVESRTMVGVLRRSRRMKYADIMVPVVSLPDLVRMKRLRGSKQDEADIDRLKKRHED